MTASDSWQRQLSADTRPDVEAPHAWTKTLVPGLTLLFHGTLSRVGESAMLTELMSDREAPISRLEPYFVGPGQPRRPLADPYLSRKPWCIRPATLDGGLEIDAGGTPTAVIVNGTPLASTRLLSSEEVDRGVVIQLAESVVLLLHRRHPVPFRLGESFDLVGESDGLLQVRRDIERVASLDVPVLLRGETGTGKEMVARAIHAHGQRRGGPLVSVNMAAIPATLAASELFGATRGAYTGAVAQRHGYFQQANGGTLFLDEIGETPEDVQPLLLRALETGEIQSVGGDRPRTVDVRLIAATDAELESRIAQGRFRAPLLHRIAGYDLRLPPLRQRKEDLGRLFFHFLKLELAGVEEQMPRKAPEWLRGSLLARLALYDWPGNVRQLRNLVRQLVIIARSAAPGEVAHRLEELISAEESCQSEAPNAAASSAPPVPAGPRKKSYRRPAEVSEEELLEALRSNGFRILPTARALGISRTSLYHLIARSERVRKPADLRVEELRLAAEKHRGSLSAMARDLEVSEPGLEQRLRQLDLRHLLRK
ncbi:MAG: sigma-54 dependent transcriptional regulator [Acidobacteriota bacterium]